jgi:hypothetical protein
MYQLRYLSFLVYFLTFIVYFLTFNTILIIQFVFVNFLLYSFIILGSNFELFHCGFLYLLKFIVVFQNELKFVFFLHLIFQCRFLNLIFFIKFINFQLIIYLLNFPKTCFFHKFKHFPIPKTLWFIPIGPYFELTMHIFAPIMHFFDLVGYFFIPIRLCCLLGINFAIFDLCFG